MVRTRQKLRQKRAKRTKRKGVYVPKNPPRPRNDNGARIAPKTGAGIAETVGSSLGSAIGNMIAGNVGSSIGKALGGGAGKIFKSITGFGDYKVTSNTLSNAMATDSLPMFTKSGRGMRVVHREYLSDVITSSTAGAFNINGYPIQPALAAGFPWLSTIASQFEEYQINGMIYEFKSNSYDALSSTNTASGTVIMTTQYNVLKPAFTNKQQMEQYEFTCSAKPSVDILHPIECARGDSPVYTLSTRSTTGITSGDLRLYDFGNFYLATVGMQGTSTNIGEIWVSYDITLLKPRLGNAGDVGDHYYLGTNADSSGTNSYFGYGSYPPILATTSNLGSTLGASTITIPTTFTGDIVVIYNLQLASSNVFSSVISVTGSLGATPLYLFSGGPYSSTSVHNGFPIAAYTSSNAYFYRYFNCVQGGVITLSGGSATSPAVLAGDLFVLALPSSLIN
jgi:cation transporter-like permease